MNITPRRRRRQRDRDPAAERNRRARGALVPRPPWDELPPWPGDDEDGGAGVREPRRPQPSSPGDALALDLPIEQPTR